MKRKYETVIALGSELQHEAVTLQVEKVKDLISGHGGVELEVEDWGRRQLAHPAKTKPVVHYFCYSYESENMNIIAELNSIFRITEEVAKFQSHRCDLKRRKFQGNPKSVGQSSETSAAV